MWFAPTTRHGYSILFMGHLQTTNPWMRLNENQGWFMGWKPRDYPVMMMVAIISVCYLKLIETKLQHPTLAAFSPCWWPIIHTMMSHCVPAILKQMNHDHYSLFLSHPALYCAGLKSCCLVETPRVKAGTAIQNYMQELGVTTPCTHSFGWGMWWLSFSSSRCFDWISGGFSSSCLETSSNNK